MLIVVSSGTAFASTSVTTTFQTQITIQPECLIVSASNLDFGPHGVLVANVDQTSTIQVQCTDTTPYTIGLDAGTGAGATVATRKMTSGGAVVNYSLYTDTNHTTVWGNTPGTDTVAGTGNGSAQSVTVFGRVPVQTTPAPATYTDTVTVTVTY